MQLAPRCAADRSDLTGDRIRRRRRWSGHAPTSQPHDQHFHERPANSGLTSCPSDQAADVAGTLIRLAEVAERSARALVELDRFRAVATITQRTEPAEETQPAEVSTRTNTISLFGDGRMWASTHTGGWASYDPSTGTSRVAAVNADGATTYQEILG